jgi:hypothetical protein
VPNTAVVLTKLSTPSDRRNRNALAVASTIGGGRRAAG